MASTLYDPAWVREFYDEYGMKEWERFDLHPVLRISFAIHTHYLTHYIRPQDRVLEIGAGAGRFTQVLAEIGARITVADISPGQLALNRRQAAAYRFAHAVEQWVECDACDLRGHFADNAFDAVVAYGGLLSYLYDQADAGLAELQRVVAPGGVLLLEVMSLWGAIHHVLPQVLTLPPEKNRPVVSTGNLDGSFGPRTHHIHMYRSREFRELLERAGLQVEVMSVGAALAATWAESLREIPEDSEAWQHLLEMELDACRTPGCLDMGEHILAVCRKAG